MHRLPVLVATLCGCTTLPALAHWTASPHAHGGDGWGLLAVVALTAVAAWIDRRRR
jgi:MYXO-CTERM domain-containing protein